MGGSSSSAGGMGGGASSAGGAGGLGGSSSSAGGMGGGSSSAGGTGGGTGGAGGAVDLCTGTGTGGGNGGAGGAAELVVPVLGVVVSTLAGSATEGSTDDVGALASFYNPVNVALDPAGDLYVSDFDNGRIRKVTSTGVVTTLTNQANFIRPFGIVFGAGANLYVQTDKDPLGQGGPLAGTFWGIAIPGGLATPIAADIGLPRGLGALPSGEIVLSDGYHHRIRKIDPTTGVITEIAGMDGCPGFADASGTAARFHRPYGVVVTSGGDILVADQHNHRIRQVTLAGDVTTFAGDGVAGMVDGPIGGARFDEPQDLAIDAAGNLYVSDNGNHRIRRISAGIVETLAGDGTAGFQDGDGEQARFYGQEGLDVTPDGKTVYVADGTNGEPLLPYHRIRKIAVP